MTLVHAAAAAWPGAELLICCARARLDAERTTRLRKLVHGGVDWEHLPRTAAAHGLLPLLYTHLAAICADAVPPAVLDRLRTGFLGNGWRNLFLTRELVTLVGALEAHAIPALAYKGPTLAALAYGNVALRQFADVDVLVRRRDMGRAVEVFAGQGYRYRPQVPMTRVQEAVFRRFACELVFASDDGRCLVDLHWGILPGMFAVALDAESLLARAGEASLGGATVRTLCPEDLLLVLCVHNGKHRWERLGWIADVAELIERRPIDWDRVRERARSVGAERMLRVGLLLASELLEAALPPDVAGRIHGDPVARSLAVRACEALFAGVDAQPRNVEDLRFYFSARERLRDKARFVLRAGTTPTVNEVALVALPAGLSFLYYPLRPLRLAMKYGRGIRRSAARAACRTSGRRGTA